MSHRLTDPCKRSPACSSQAFKPNDDGWGYTRSYASGWDKIFKKGPGKKEDAAPASPSPEIEASQVDVELRQKQLAALDAALKCGALSSKLFGQAVAELDGKKE